MDAFSALPFTQSTSNQQTFLQISKYIRFRIVKKCLSNFGHVNTFTHIYMHEIMTCASVQITEKYMQKH